MWKVLDNELISFKALLPSFEISLAHISIIALW
jgi:hypothetical protein